MPVVAIVSIKIKSSVIIAVITNEKHKQDLIKLSKGANLIAPASLHWEIGNAFSAMLKRKRVSVEQAISALAAYREIPLQFSEVDLETALELSSKFKIYAYNAYVISCALKHKSPLVTLDEKLIDIAQSAGAAIREVKP